MKISFPEPTPDSLKVFVACLLSFSILIAPIAAMAAPKVLAAPKAKEAKRLGTVSGAATKASTERVFANAPVPEPAPAPPFAAVVTSSMTDNRPAIDPASAKPGDTINYTVTIQNTGDADATGVQFNDDIDVHTAYVNGSGILAMSDLYNTIGEVSINVPAPGLLTNDLDLSAGNNTGMTTTAQTVSSAQCAGCSNVTIGVDGSFTYDPKAGFTGTDSFTYTAKNAANKSASATVQITVTGRIWFVNNNAGACASNCDGRLSHPFTSLANFQAVNDGGVGHPQDNDVVFLFENTAATAYVGPVTLRTGQKFIGQDATASLISISGLTQPSGTDPLPPTNSGNGNIVDITSAANAINLGSGNLLRGFKVSATTGTKISGTNFGTLIVGDSGSPDVTLAGNGQALSLTTGTLSVAGGFASVATTSSTAQGINLSGVADSDGAGGSAFSFGSTTVSGSTTQGILIGTTTADLNFGTTAVGTAVAGTGGTNCISLQNNSSGTRTFGALTLQNNTGANATFTSAVGGGNSTAGATTISGVSATGQGINIQSLATGTSAIFGATSITMSSTAAMVNLGGVALGNVGAVTFASLSGSNGNGPGLVAAENTGTITVTNAGAAFSTTNGGAINVTKTAVPLTPIDMDFGNVSAGGTNANAINFSLVSGTFTSTGGTLTATGPLFTITGGTVSTTYAGNITQGNNAAMVSVSGGHATGTVTFNTGTLTATNGTGLQFDNADGTYNFNGTNTLSNTVPGGDAGVDILNDSSGSFTFSAATTITSPTGIAFNVNGGAGTASAAVTYGGAITQANNFATVNVTKHNTGTITFAVGSPPTSGQLSATNGTGLQFNDADGTYNFNGTNTLNGGDAGIDITNGSAGTFGFSNNTTITNPTGTCFNFNTSTGGVTYNGNITKSGTSAGLIVDITGQASGTITFQNGTLSSTSTAAGATGINLNNVDGTVNFNGTNTLSGAGANAGIDITTGSAGTIVFSTTTSITSPSGIAYNEDTSTANVTYNGTITQNSAASAVRINVKTGGTTTFTRAAGSQITAATTTANAIDLTGNTGGTINFTGGLGLTSSTGTSFNVSGGNTGMTLTATQDNTTIINTINSTAGSGLNVNNATIGATGLTFRSISSGTGANSAGNGITLNTTGSTGKLTVTGNGGSCTIATPTCSGGQIQHKTGADASATSGSGIYLNSTSAPTFTLMHINDVQNHGIRGISVTGFSLTNSIINGSNGTSSTGPNEEGAARFDNLNTSGAFPTAVITDCVLGGTTGTDSSFSDNLRVTNTSGTLNRLIITNTSFGNIGINGTNGLAFSANNNITMNLTVQDSFFTNAIGSLSTITFNQNSTMDLVFRRNKLSNNNVNQSSGGGGFVLQGGSGGPHTVTYDISCNKIQDAIGIALLVASGNGSGTVSGSIINNAIGIVDGTPGTAPLTGSTQASGIKVKATGTGTHTTMIRDNTIRETNEEGIFIQNNDGSATLNASVFNNVVTSPGPFSFAGLNVDIGAIATDTSIANVVVGSFSVAGNKNDFSAGDPTNFSDVNLSRIAGAGTQLNLSRNGSASGTPAGVIDDDNLNPANTNTGVSGTVTLVNTLPATPAAVAACTQPAFFRPDVDPKGQFNAQANPPAPTFTASIAGDAHSFAERINGASMTAAAHSLIQSFSGSAITAEAHNIVKQPVSSEGLIAHARKTLSSIAHGISSAIEPTAYAESNAQRSDVRSNHARSVRTSRGSVTSRSTALEPAPFAPCGPINTPTGHICVDIGTLRPGDSVQIGFSVTVNNPPNLTLLTPAPRVATQGSVTGSFGAVNTDDPDVGGGSDSTETPIDLFDVKFDSLTSSLNPSTPADPVTYTATISVDTALQTPPVGTVPTGSITFRDNGVDIGTCTNVAISGAGPWTAQCTIAGGTYVGGSSHPITAKYNGSGNFDTLVSGTLTQNVVNCGNPAIVTKIADTNDGTCDADCSLREAIATVCSGGTVQFDTAGVFATPQTITLSLGELSVPANMTINGPDAAGNHVSVSGGGASRVFKINSGKTVTIRELSITGGSTAANGAGIWNDHGILTLINLDINSNTSTSVGGGVYNDATAGGTATLNVFSSTLNSNNAFEGGALYNYATGGGTGTVNVVNSTVSGNNANGPGGGLSALETGGTATVTIINSTITNNRADNDNDASGTGGGIFNAATFILHNTIVAGNFNEDGVSDSNDDINGTAVSAASSNNLIGDAATAGGLTDTTNGNIVGVGGIGTRAIGTILDTTLANNGGLTLTHKLVGGSVAIEAGSNANLPADTFDLDGDADTAETLPVDQRGVGYPRNADSADADAIQTVDIGAYELHPTIEDITDKTTAEDTALPGFAFNIGDGTGALITSVTATSSNTTVVPNLPANISLTGAGSTRTLTITPAADKNTVADGAVVITVTVTATNGQTAQDTFNLFVTEVNDAPVPVNDTVSDIDEDCALGCTAGVYQIPIAPVVFNDAKGPANESGQTLTVTGVSNPVGGTVVINGTNFDFTPTANFNGSAGFDYTVQDDGTTNGVNDFKSANGQVSFNINPINDAPSFVKGADQSVNKNAGAQTVTNWATAISAGPPDEVTAGQTVSFNVSVTGTTGSLAFTSPPAVSPSGTLTYTATNGTSGTATVDVSAVDTGVGAPPPNSNTSAPQTFTITVTGVNVAPVNTVPASVSMPQNTVYTFTGAAISVADVDAAETDNVISVALNATNGTMNLSGTVGLTFTGGSNGSAAMTFEGTIPDLNTALNNMTFTPTTGYTGAASIQMVSNDLGKTGTGGPQTDDDTINITVTAGAAMYINEVLFNPPGTDAPNEYIELRGPANTTIPVGTYLVAIEGDAADNPGDVQTIINVSGLSFGANGFLVLLQNGNTYTTDAGATVLTSTTAGFGGLPGAIFQADGGATDIEDSSVTFMLIQTGAAPSLTDDIDVNDDGLTDGFVFAGWNVRDSISAMNGSANARAYGAFSFRNTAGSGTSLGPEVIVNFIPSYVGRIGDSTGSTAADWVASGILGGAAPNWTLGVAAETEPASFASKALNHIGASNFANLAPVNSVPAATQNVNEDFVLTFNAGNANLISISDPDAGGADVKVTLTATNGTMSLSGTAGLTFTPPAANNDGVNDTQMIFTGTIAAINTALDGMTFTPTLDYFGGATIQIVTDDQGNVGVGGAKTDTDTVNINVNAINDPPSFALAGNPAAVNEDSGAQTVNGFASSISQGPGESGQTPLTFNVTPTGAPTGNISFASGPAIDATTGNLTYTTNADTNGSATFNVTLSDSGSNVAPNSNTSGTQQFTITVNAVNDAPTFLIPSNPPAVNEDAGAQTVNSFTTNFQPGPPAATDEVGQTLVGYAVTQTGTTGNLTFTSAPSISNAGALTYTPTGDTSGTATFNVVATDSGSGVAPNVNQSAPVAFTITVNGQNDAPVMDNTGNMSLNAINEDVPNASNPGTLVSDVILSAGGDRITDLDAGAVEGIAVFAVNNANGTWQYSIDNGTNWLPFGTPDALNSRLLASNATTRVRFIPNLNFNGTVDPGLTFRAWDQTSGTNGNTADTSAPGGISAFSTATETASITVNPDNDTPTTTGIPPVTVNEDAANTVLNLRLSFNDVEDGNDLAYTVQANTNPSLFSSVSINNANDNLTLAYTANASGSAQITIRGTDVGGLFVESTFTVTVNSSNDPPTFTKGSDPTTFQNSGPQTVTNWATGMSPGPADESGQTLTFNVTGNTNAALFSAQPAINATTGTLTYTGANNASGNATITITLSDNGGILNGGNDTSAPQSFVITITPCVNPATVINTNDNGAGSLRDAITNVCAGGTINFDPALNGQTITLTSGELAISKNLTINGPGANLLTISGNNASRIFNIASTFTVGISGLTMSNGRVNTALSEGGAIQNNGTLTITGSTISGNTVNGSGFNLGGGISNRTTGNLTLRDSTISGNSATGGGSNDGGGIYNQGVAKVINSTISGNSSSLGGGFSQEAGGNVSMVNSTVSGNSALFTGGLQASGTVNVRNTIIAGNTSPFSPDVRNAFVSQGNNLIGASDGSTGFTNGVNNDKVGTVASPLNALLAPLGNYGGPTQTFALLPGSPAIDAANNCVTDVAHCGDANIPQLTTDQRGAGFNRLVNTTVDIGAFESRGFTIAVTSGNPQSAVFNTAFGAPLVATVTSGSGEPVSGGQVVFTAPGSGASATFTGGVTTIVSVINAGGQASASATANATVGGPYNVTATGNGVTGTASFNLTNIKANQTINFAALANKTFGDPDFGVSATATSGLPVSFAPSGNCTVTSPSPGTVHITGAGSCTITAAQTGDPNYNAATEVPQSFTIAKAATNTALSSSVNPSDLGQSVTFTATVTSGAGTPTGTVQFKDNGNNLGAPVAVNASGVAQLTTSALTSGTHTITADYSGDANFLLSSGTLTGGQVVRPQPSLSINDVSVTEGDAGTKVLNFTVTLSSASNLTVSVDYATANSTATAPSDYTAIASTLLTFNPGDTSKNVSVTINGDIGFEPDETFFVNLSNPVNATISDNQGLGTIQNDDAQGGFISFGQPNYNVSESTGVVTVTVTRSNDVSQAVNVDYATDDTGASTNCAALNTGLAAQRCDYTSMFGTLRFAANETQKTVDIPINLDAYTEGPEVFTFNLSNATGGAVLSSSTATVTISDSPSPTPNANDDTTTFVRQQYRDFLNREADPAGLAFWKNNIDKCNDPAQRPAGQTLAACIEVQRILTSAAFFLSLEFRGTGGLVRDFYVAALDRPFTNNMPGFVEFMRDAQAIQKGVVVGQGNWQQVLDANRLAFMSEFVTRAEFVALYPTTDTPTQYVDKLYLHAKLTQTQQERLDAIEYFGGAATAADTGARARALLLITQNGDFQARELNRGFVQMQYFGYLRRNPNDPPDGNFNGFNFWVTKLNQFNGDFLQAEMVKAFLTSLEYRRRFGP